jgi:hypothetical protein
MMIDTGEAQVFERTLAKGIEQFAFRFACRDGATGDVL